MIVITLSEISPFFVASNYNGHDSGRDYDSNPSESKSRHDKPERYDKKHKTEEKYHKHSNGDHSGSKRKYHSSEVNICWNILCYSYPPMYYL